jgi:hypothetical protein
LIGAGDVVSFGCSKGAAIGSTTGVLAGSTTGVLAGSVIVLWEIAASSTTFVAGFSLSVLVFSAPPCWMRSRAACRNFDPASAPATAAVGAGVATGVAAGVLGAADDFFTEDRSIGLPFLSCDSER